MKITRTAHGLRLSQHGVVISELRTSSGPTHSVFDVLAALIGLLAPTGRVGLLGFAGGGMMAPLSALAPARRIDSVDLDLEAYHLFRRHCPRWRGSVQWTHSDAAVWLQAQPRDFALLVEDLSIPKDGDVVKPEISWTVMPQLIRRRLNRDGVGVFNLLPPTGTAGGREIRQIAAHFPSARVIDFREFQNRILVVGKALPSARTLGSGLRESLHMLHSRQAGRVRLRQVPSSGEKLPTHARPSAQSSTPRR
ncbi:MAG: hypothetical protein JNN07_05275 [Verrucomicrobiales bacterium]|nr:hypothetical protein [Verrucomicrobiales bacterium]